MHNVASHRLVRQ